MHSFEVHSNESMCRKSGSLWMEQVYSDIVGAVGHYKNVICNTPTTSTIRFYSK